MIENEMANIKERLAKYIKYLFIVSIVVFVIALVSLLYAHSREIMTAFGVPLTKKVAGEVVEIHPGYYEHFLSLLRNTFSQAQFGTVDKSVLTDEQKELANTFAENNIGTLVSMFKAFTIVGMILSLIPIAGCVLYLVGTKKENNKLTKIAGFVTLGALAINAIYLLIFTISFSSKGYVLQGAIPFFVNGACFLVGSLLAALVGLVMRLFFPTLSIQKVKKSVHYGSLSFALVALLSVVGGLIYQLVFIRETIVDALSTVDLFYIITTFCTSFGLISYNLLINNLMPLEINSENNELYQNLKQMATENVARKEAKNRKKALAK